MPDSILVPMRVCAKCGTSDRSNSGNCRLCHRVNTAARRALNPEKTRADGVAWYAANSERVRAKKAAWNAANPGKVREAKRASKAKNPEKVKASTDKWRQDNASRVKAAVKAWNAANPKAIRIHKQNRRARTLASGGQLSPNLHEKLFDLQKGKCPCCRLPLGDDYHLDHRVPLLLGGSNTDDNMQLLRAICNLQKGAKEPTEFMQSRGFLL